MKIDHVYATVKTILRTNMDVVVLSIIYLLIVIFGGICVYLAEHVHPGANITTIGDALWWGIVTIATVGYGDYYPVTAVGRIIAIFMMLSGIGIFIILVGSLSQRVSKSLSVTSCIGFYIKIIIRNLAFTYCC